jgi:catechol 2,3-dioxygenase-like lactoylglutathione lyase family enzyme
MPVLPVTVTIGSQAAVGELCRARLRRVKDLNESVNFYTKVMGFQEPFLFKDKNDNPTTIYLQINRDTFLELAAATAECPAGLSHMGIWADDLNATVAALRQRA